MKFLADENIPKKLVRELIAAEHDVTASPVSSPDSEVARRASDEKRVVITLDNDFVLLFKYSKIQFDVIFIQLHPPYKEVIIQAVHDLLAVMPPHEIKGLIVIEKSGYSRFTK